MAKLEKIPGTLKPEQVVEQMPEQVMVAPLELVVHTANMGVRKIPTPDGTLTILQMMTPVGIMLSLKFDDEGVDNLVRQLKGMDIVTNPGIIIPG